MERRNAKSPNDWICVFLFLGGLCLFLALWFALQKSDLKTASSENVASRTLAVDLVADQRTTFELPPAPAPHHALDHLENAIVAPAVKVSDSGIRQVSGEGPSLLPAPATPPANTGPTLGQGMTPGFLPGPGTQPLSQGGKFLQPPKLDAAPNVLPPPTALPAEETGPFYRAPVDAPLGFTGRSGVLPRDVQQDNHFVPMEDRWRIGFPDWDRYGKGHPSVDDYPFVKGNWWDPFNQNVLKGDYPILGQHTFLEVTASTRILTEPRQVPTATTPFESTARPNSEQFLGEPNQRLYSQFFALSLDLFHGDAAFKPVDWRLKITPVFNVNYLAVDELAVVNPNERRGLDRGRTFMALQEWFGEVKLADIGPNYDFVSVRAGSQPFNSDFRGFIFADVNRAVRLFGTRNSNREQFNLIYFQQLEKDTNSFLNTFSDRDQGVLIANYYIQDFIWPGYTAQASVHYNHDNATTKFDRNNVLVRPDPVGIFQPHRLDVAYLGWTGQGHINRINISHAFYWALGRDHLNPLANRAQDINGQMAALELSYDRDWIRFRTSAFYSSGDRNPRNGHATGFDSIMDNPNFAGGEFSYWQRQTIRLFGVNLTNRQSLIPDLRSSKFQGQANFVNPGLMLANLGMDFDVTPKFRTIANANFLWFDNTSSLKQFVYQNNIRTDIGTDLSLGFEYRPYLNNNVIFTGGIATLLPGDGFKDLYNNLRDEVDPLFAAFVDMAFTF